MEMQTWKIVKKLPSVWGIFEKMDLFGLHSDNSLRQQLIVYDAVIKYKLMYGLESLELTEALPTKLNTFQLNGAANNVENENDIC